MNEALSEANLNLIFAGEDGTELRLRWRFFRTDTSVAKIKEIIACVLENGSIFEPVPLKLLDAKYTKVRELVPVPESGVT